MDDDPALRDVVCRALKARGHHAVGAGDGAQAIAFLDTIMFDLVVIDLLMPGVDGVEAIVRIRSSSHRPKVLAMSGGGILGATTLLQLAVRIGADATLPKPFSGDELLAAVETLLR